MDDFVDELFSSSPWADVSTTETSSWVGNGHAQNDGILADSIRTYEENEKNLAMNLSSLPVNGDSVYDIEKNLHIEEAQSQEQVLLDQDRQQLLVNDNLEAGYMGMQSNMYQSTLGTMNYSSPELISIVDGSSQSPCAPPESGSVGSNDTETSGVHPIMGESHSISSIPQIWSNPSYVGVSSISPVLGQDKLQGLDIEGEYVNTDANVFGNGYVTDDLNLQTGNLNASMPVQGEQYNYGLNSFPANHQIPMARTATMQSQLQLPQLSDVYPTSLYPDQNRMSQLPNSSVGAGDGSNGAVKPRVRARRGQATDPHSIAERLRREKISERMKNLQELVPSSTKSDKASVLDEIIEYVKFLQHQVKVLSMSRLGAAGAVVPLITEGHAELGSGGVLLPQSTVKANDRYDSPDDIAFEEEVVKLMESNVTEAMQYLQTKGLCLMPVALASAISSLKASSSPDSSDQKKPDLGQNNGPPAISNSQISAKEKPLKTENTVSLKVKEDVTSRGCNVTVTNLRETEKKKE